LEQADTAKAKKIARQKLDGLIVFIALVTQHASFLLFLLEKARFRHFHGELVSYIGLSAGLDSQKQTAGKTLRPQKVSRKQISTLEKARLVC